MSILDIKWEILNFINESDKKGINHVSGEMIRGARNITSEEINSAVKFFQGNELYVCDWVEIKPYYFKFVEITPTGREKITFIKEKIERIENEKIKIDQEISTHIKTCAPENKLLNTQNCTEEYRKLNEKIEIIYEEMGSLNFITREKQQELIEWFRTQRQRLTDIIK